MADIEAAPAEATALPPTWTLYTPRQRWWLLAILFLVSTSNYVDRQIVTILLEPIKAEFQVSDTMLGLLTGFSFAIFYATLGIPVARLSDRANRKRIIAVSLTVWSLFTMLCGYAQQFWHLMAARFGVGAGEAGAIPPSQSLLADYFPPDQRGRALGIFMMSAMGGYLIAFVGGAQVAQTYGWRTAFIVMGLPGLLLAVIVMLGLSEPRSRPGRAVVQEGRETLSQSWSALIAKPGFVNLAIAMVLYFIVSYGGFVFIPSFMIRVYGVQLAEIGFIYGAASAVTTVIGSWAGGFMSDRMSKRDRRWIAWTPAVILSACTPAFLIALMMPSFPAFVIAFLIPNILLTAGGPTLFTHLHAICGSPRRATSVAIIFFFANLIGLGLGPVFAGAMSDWFTARLGRAGIRWSLLIVMCLFLPAGWFMYRAGRTLETDLEA